jgi:hypothetical protein
MITFTGETELDATECGGQHTCLARLQRAVEPLGAHVAGGARGNVVDVARGPRDDMVDEAELDSRGPASGRGR